MVAAHVAEDVRRHDAPRGGFAGEGDILYDPLPVDRHRERAPHPHVVKRLPLDVETVEVAGVKRIEAEDGRVFAAIDRDFRQGHVVGDVELPGAEHAFLGVRKFHGIQVKLVELDPGAVPVSRGPCADDQLAGSPSLENERSVAHEVFGAGPCGAFAVEPAELPDGGDWHRLPRLVVHRVQQERRGLAQRQPQRERVGHLETGLGKVSQPAFVEFLGANHVPQHVRVGGAERRREHAPEALVKIVGRDRLAV